MTYGQFGIIAGLQKYMEECGEWLIKAIILFLKCNDIEEAQRNAQNFMVFYDQVDPETKTTLKAMWMNAGLGEFPVSSVVEKPVAKVFRKILKWLGL